MIAQGKEYSGNSVKINNTRQDGSRLGDRNLTYNIIDGKRYYSSIDAEIYIGGDKNTSYIDDLLQINWSIEQATLPLFGYNSYTFDDLAIGVRQITGSFVINFTKSGYLYDVLRNTPGVNRASFYENIPKDEQLIWKSKFDKYHTPLWDRSFNILIGYGDYNKNPDTSTLTLLECVQLTGCQQVINTEGTPIAEAYTFMAKDIRYDTSDLPNNPPEEIVTDPNIDKPKPQEPNFIFTPKEIKIERLKIIIPDQDNSIISYTMKFGECVYSNGTPINIKVKFYSSNKNELVKSYMQIPFQKKDNFAIPTMYASALEKEIMSNKTKYNISDNTVYITCDLIIEYKKDSSDINRFSLNNQQINVVLYNKTQ